MSSATSPPADTSSSESPPHPAASPGSITVSFADVWAGRAYIRIPPIGRVLLAHWAGAPWWDKDSDAFLHGQQTEALMRKEREKIVHGGSRLGKSVLGGGCDALATMLIPRARLGIVSDKYEHVGDEWQYLDRGLRTLFPDGHAFVRLAFRNSQNYHDFEAHTIWGALGRGFSAESDEGGNLLGKPFDKVIVGEGSKVSKMVLDARIMRACNGALMRPQDGSPVRETGYISIYTTPDEFSGCSAAEWERVMLQTKREPERLHYGATPFASTVWIREADVLENPHYDRTAYEAARASMDSRAFAEQMRGKMVYATGRVLHHYEPLRHLRAPLSPEEVRALRLGVGLDTGAYTGWVLAGIAPDRHKHILGELYTEKLDFAKSMDLWRAKLVELLLPAFPVLAESASVDDAVSTIERLQLIDVWAVDPASQHKLDFSARMPFILTPATAVAGGKLELLPSLDLYNRWFRDNEISLVQPETGILQQQLERYRWKTASVSRAGLAKEPSVKEPHKEYDHLIDSSRFVLSELERMGPRAAAPLADWADVWRKRRTNTVFGPLQETLRRAEAAGGMRS